ncbi:MAG: MBL fold metallo-hydrolase, partial [Phycisphaeraceae bacterium]|nr:MBL fold metallo-hydrolase [Phycisphaeraceae bacterium]
GRCRFMGFVARFGEWAVYHSGDTMLYEGMADLLAPFRVDLALLPINGRRPERRVAGNLWGDEAAQLARDIGAGMAIPCHYDMFEFNTESPQQFIEACEKIDQPCQVLENGGRWVRAGQRTGR